MKSGLAYSSLTVLAFMAPVAAVAQTQSTPPVAAAAAQPSTGLEDIVVTAQRRSENLQDVPISITAVTASKLSASGITNAQALIVATPALSVDNAIGYFLPRLRGIGTASTGPGFENSIATYVDNAYLASAPAALFTFNNIERVEILKGPQGTLFGRNATGGVINVITKDPSHTAGGSASISYGNYNTVSGNLYLTTGLTDTAAIDFSFTGSHQGDGYGINLATGRDVNKTNKDIAFRSKLLWEPTSTTQLRLSGDYSDTDGSYPSIREFQNEQPVFGPKTGGSPWDVNVDQPSRVHVRSGGATLRIDQSLGGAKLVSISAFRKSDFLSLLDFDLTPTPAAYVSIAQKDHQFSQELQLQSGSASKVKWVAGVYYFHGYATYDPNDLVVGFPLDQPGSPFFPFQRIRTLGNVKTDSYAGFGQVTVPVTDTTNVTGGLRYTHESRSIDGDTQGVFANGATIDLVAPGAGKQSKDFNKLTWRVSVDQKIGDALLYASFNRGFKAGGFNLGTPDRPAYEPEVLDAYEVGLKAEFLDRHLRFNPAFFYYNYTNIQVPIVLLSGVLGTINGPAAKVYGLDVDGEAIVTKALHITFGVTLIHDRFGNYPNAIANVPQAAGGNVATTFNAKGNRLAFTADFASSVGVNYTANLGASKLNFEVDWNHNDGYFTDVDNLRRQGAYDLANASITWSAPNDRFNVRAWIRNIGNDDIVIFNNVQAFASAASYQPPRTYGVTIGTKF